MNLRIITGILLALVAAGCNRTAATNNAANAVAPAPQSNVVIAPPLAPPALGNGAKPIVPEPEVDAEETVEADGCVGEIGQRAADQLVLQCRDVSPATRPPCNFANSCAMIRDEIARGCGMLGDDAPEYCPVG